MIDDDQVPGLHESLLTRGLAARLEASALHHDLRDVDPADQPDVLARHLAEALRRRMPKDEAGRAQLVARLLDVLAEPEAEPLAPIRQLVRLAPPETPGARQVTTIRPSTPLSDVALLTNAPGEPHLGHEIKAEIASADRVDLLCAFVQWHGLRFLEAELLAAKKAGVPIRVVTTTYIGGTERRALDRLIEDFGAKIRVQYDARIARLHAKAWLFRRNTGFHTAYVGSSNLSRAALIDGSEWNVRLSAVHTGHLLDKFVATFDSYWNSDQFEPYRGAEDAERLDRCLAEAKGGRATQRSLMVSGLDVRPYPYQAAILDALRSERENRDHHQNLVVAATGTGKTVMAALDYRSMCSGSARPRLLFVAHRREILEQSLRTYREVLADGSFGELFVDGNRPRDWQHVFASIQSLTSLDIATMARDAFDVVVVDEFHHAEAASYRRLLTHLQPRELLGLTATPERGDGLNVRGFFGGRIAAELRVWDAIQQGLLAPFHYFGVSDTVDLSRVPWTKGRYDQRELDKVYTGNDAAARIVVKQVHDKVLDPASMKAIGFCVSVRHAHFMAEKFNVAGLPSVALSGESTSAERDDAIHRLRAGELCCVFTVDLFNEGVDIPEVDTILLLRPTESPTIFLQQLGRGLRVHPSKDVLTVLDFVAQHRKEYRLDLRFRALTGQRGKELERQAEQGFPLLPSGCQIVLDRVAQQRVLDNMKQQLSLRWTQMAGELRNHPTDSLEDFLEGSGVQLSQVLGDRERGWTQLRAKAGLIPAPTSDEELVLRRIRPLAHIDDPERLREYRRVLDGDAAHDVWKRMMFFTLWPNGGGFNSIDEGLASLRDKDLFTDEAKAVMDIQFAQSRALTAELDGPLAELAMRTHASYSREEILAALGHATTKRLPSGFREGVLATTFNGTPVDAFFITLKKSEANYSPTTLYRDYPISRELFHWESQSTTSVESATGQRYLTGGSIPLLFVRQARKDEFGTAPYIFLGPASYVSHTGSKPIAITWRLHRPMPAELFTQTAIAV